ncbi:MAG: type II toxin-antitoxin system Phd/YefM family antitoxin [Betaproteobacteria bacterium]
MRSILLRERLDGNLYGLYSQRMSRIDRKGVEETRAELPAVLDAAAKGRTTLVTRHGRPVAAIVPINQVSGQRQKPLLPLVGSGKGLWGKDSTRTLRKLRDEWSR